MLQPSNFQAHNLCTSLTPPKHFNFLLGLGLRFCPQGTFTTGSIRDQTRRFERDIFIKYLFSTDTEENDDFDPRLYVKSNYQVNRHDIDLVLQLQTSSFLSELSKRFKRKQFPSNLLPTQRRLLQTIILSDKLFVIRTDKNLGPAIIERTEYIKRAYLDHLSDKLTYRRLTHAEAHLRIRTVTGMVQRFIIRNQFQVSKNDCKFISKTLQNFKDPFSHFYILAKIHKIPWTTRPICSISGSLLHGLGKWVDVQLQPIVALLPTFLSSSFVLKDLLDELPDLPPNAKLFTADAVSMYPNINTHHALQVISHFLRTHPLCLANNVEHIALLEALTIVMSHNVFQFGDTFWVQLTGTAMGSPPAPTYATLYFAIKEFELLDQFSVSLFFYRRYIDDVVAIWVQSNKPNAPSFESLENAMSFGQLKWVVSPLATSVVFLDVTFSIL